MTEELNQKVSQLLDDDLNCEEALELLIKLQKQPDLQVKMSRYEAMSHALKSEAFIPVQLGFAQRIHEEIKKEPVFICPRRKPVLRAYWTVAALAASVAIVAVLVQQPEPRPNRPFAPAPLMVAISETPVLPPQSLNTVASLRPDEQQAELRPAASRLTEYLQAHNSSRYIDGSVNFQPYAQVVSYSQE